MFKGIWKLYNWKLCNHEPYVAARHMILSHAEQLKDTAINTRPCKKEELDRAAQSARGFSIEW
ncbi:hypothetical protein SLEP1_g27274 [Rubroshorea leprosula]|uniref:Uncharacterized protein n=1 Tax=Rubroshorea leprosula TaxID=152421 RepID=A0AAV5K2F3_9ROSI|nr:hypothetical protein SLEP1_g27274 [Rubroshorea leprosula]